MNVQTSGHAEADSGRSAWTSFPSVKERMDAHRGAGPGFDHARLVFSALVILVHSFRISYYNTDYLYASWFGPVISVILPMFFALSGFLVTGSALRNNLFTFISFRVLRIVPALATEVTLSALILAPLVTTVPLREYFASREFLTYFGNIVGWIHFYLPGVFENQPQHAVNLNLWTLHPELECYAVMAGLIATTLVRRRWLMAAGWLIATLVLAFGPFDLSANARFGTFGGTVLIYYFVTGIVAYQFREYIPINPFIAIAFTVATYFLVRFPAMTFIVPPMITYLMIWLGMQRLPRIEFLQRGDYSYGLYLYGFPVQQTLHFLFAPLREWYTLFPVSLVVTLLFAMASWHAVEKPALALKRLVAPRKPHPPAAQNVDLAPPLPDVDAPRLSQQPS